jgi:hypothetical protein
MDHDGILRFVTLTLALDDLGGSQDAPQKRRAAMCGALCRSELLGTLLPAWYCPISTPTDRFTRGDLRQPGRSTLDSREGA